MDTLYTIQRSLYTVFNLLPAILMLTMLTLGFGIGNLGMISIFVGQLVTSVGVLFLRLFSSGLQKNRQLLYSLIPGDVSVQFPSIWLANIGFFISAVVFSAYDVYNIDPAKKIGSDPAVIAQMEDPIFKSKVGNRKTRCIMIIATTIIIGILLSLYRMWVVEGHSIFNIGWSLASLAIGILAAVGWYYLSIQENLGIQNMDIFGISQQLISVTQTDVKTMCELKAVQ